MPSSPFHMPLLSPAVVAGCLLTMPIGARAEDRLKALSAGFNMHISKPVEPAELIVVIANLTESNF